MRPHIDFYLFFILVGLRGIRTPKCRGTVDQDQPNPAYQRGFAIT